VANHEKKIVLEPAQIVTQTAAEELTRAQKRWLDARLAEGLADIKAGRVHGPLPLLRKPAPTLNSWSKSKEFRRQQNARLDEYCH